MPRLTTCPSPPFQSLHFLRNLLPSSFITISSLSLSSSSSSSMASPNPNPEDSSSSSPPAIYPTVQIPSPPSPPVEDFPLSIPNAILHLIDKDCSIELAAGDLILHRLSDGDDTLAVLASVADQIQWPLTKDVATVKLDDSHYFFSFTPPKEDDTSSSENHMLSYGLTITSGGGEDLDGVLEKCTSFTVGKVETALDGSVDRCAAYWTTLAPNVEDYSGTAAKYIASGSGHLIKGILWCGDVTSDRLKWGNDVLRKRLGPGAKAQISPEAMQRIQRVKSVSKMTEKVALGVLSGAVRVSGYFTSSLVNSRVGKKFFGLLPGEVLLASLDGFSKICDAVEVAGKNVMSTSSTVTAGLVDHRYGEEAAKATTEGLDAAGHAVGTAWTVLKLRQALNPKSVLKPTALTKAVAAAEKKTKDSK